MGRVRLSPYELNTATLTSGRGTVFPEVQAALSMIIIKQQKAKVKVKEIDPTGVRIDSSLLQ